MLHRLQYLSHLYQHSQIILLLINLIMSLKLTDLCIQIVCHDTSNNIYPHCYCIVNHFFIVEGEDFAICHENTFMTSSVD